MPEYIGNTFVSPEETIGSKIVLDEFGVSQATEAFLAAGGVGVAFAQSLTVHPNYSWLKRKSASIVPIEGGWEKVTVEYEGIPPETDIAQYRLEVSTSTEPIDTHPDFETLIGGSYVKPLNGAVFDENGIFQNFKAVLVAGDIEVSDLGQESVVTSKKKNRFGGIQSYLVPSMIWNETLIRGGGAFIGGPDLDDTGKISNPDGNPPTIGGRNWLMLGGTQQEVGFGYRLNRRYRMSGRDGWIKIIY